MALLQMNRFCFNVILLLIMVSLHPSIPLGLQTTLILLCGVLHLVLLICYGDMAICRNTTRQIVPRNKVYRFSDEEIHETEA